MYFLGSVCVFLRETLLKVIFLCRKIMKYLKIKYILLVYFTSFTVCSGDEKKALKMKKTTLKMKKSSENEKKKALKMISQLVISELFSSPEPKAHG